MMFPFNNSGVQGGTWTYVMSIAFDSGSETSDYIGSHGGNIGHCGLAANYYTYMVMSYKNLFAKYSLHRDFPTAHDGEAIVSQTANKQAYMWYGFGCDGTSLGKNVVFANGWEIPKVISSVATPESHSDGFWLGKIGAAYGKFIITEFAAYNRRLSSAEMSILYNNGAPYNHLEGPLANDLDGWYRFGDNKLDEFDGDGIILGNEGKSEIGEELWTSNADNGDVTNWNGYGNNTVTTDSGMIKVTYVDNANGVSHYLRAAYNLSTDLTVGSIYRIQFDAKVNTGTVNLYIGNSVAAANRQNITNTSMQTYVAYFKADHATNCYFRINNMGTGEIVHLDNFSLREVTNYPAIGINMGDSFVPNYKIDP